MEISIQRLEGRVIAWVPPPPSDRLYYSFLEPPILEARTQVVNMQGVLAKSGIA